MPSTSKRFISDRFTRKLNYKNYKPIMRTVHFTSLTPKNKNKKTKKKRIIEIIRERINLFKPKIRKVLKEAKLEAKQQEIEYIEKNNKEVLFTDDYLDDILPPKDDTADPEIINVGSM